MYKIHKAVRILCDSQQMGKGRQNDTWYPTVTKSGRTNQSSLGGWLLAY